MPTTARDLCTQALKDAGVVGVGQTPLAEDINDVFVMLKQMIAQWRRQRWLVYVLRTESIVSTGAQSYTVGTGGSFNMPRPDRLEAAYFRQVVTTSPNQVDYPMRLIQSREQYNLIALKTLSTWPDYAYYQSDLPLGHVFFWPVPQATIYSLFLTVKHELQSFANLSDVLVLPEEYEAAIRYNLALRLGPAYQIEPLEQTKRLAKAALAIIRGANTQMQTLQVPDELVRPGLYNVFTDRSY